jgi:hypothetical protein
MTITSLFVRAYNAMVEARMRAAIREISYHPMLRQQMLATAEAAAQNGAKSVPQNEVKNAGYKATYADAGMLPFVRGA